MKKVKMESSYYYCSQLNEHLIGTWGRGRGDKENNYWLTFYAKEYMECFSSIGQSLKGSRTVL